MGERGNPYGKVGGGVAKEIIDRVIRENFKENNNRNPSDRTIGEMSDEIMKLVHENVKFIN